MFRTVTDFLDEWREESEGTLKLLRTLTDESLEQKVSADGRTLGRLAWHITLSIGEMLRHCGIAFESVPEDAPVPGSAAEVAERYAADSAAAGPAVRRQWTDEMLADEVPMYGEMWKRGTVLSVLIRHQTHHRGQMTVLMRQAGLRVAGLYGPAREEWAAIGRPPAD